MAHVVTDIPQKEAPQGRFFAHPPARYVRVGETTIGIAKLSLTPMPSQPVRAFELVHPGMVGGVHPACPPIPWCCERSHLSAERCHVRLTQMPYARP